MKDAKFKAFSIIVSFLEGVVQRAMLPLGPEIQDSTKGSRRMYAFIFTYVYT